MELVFVGECEVHLNPALTKVWSRPGELAQVAASGEDKKANVFGARNFRTGRAYWRISERRNSEQFLAFFQQL